MCQSFVSLTPMGPWIAGLKCHGLTSASSPLCHGRAGFWFQAQTGQGNFKFTSRNLSMDFDRQGFDHKNVPGVLGHRGRGFWFNAQTGWGNFKFTSRNLSMAFGRQGFDHKMSPECWATEAGGFDSILKLAGVISNLPAAIWAWLLAGRALTIKMFLECWANLWDLGKQCRPRSDAV